MVNFRCTVKSQWTVLVSYLKLPLLQPSEEKDMRMILFVMFALSVSLSTQPAHAKLVLVFDDPATESEDLVIEDNGPLDEHGWAGEIKYCQPAGSTNMLCVDVFSKPEAGTTTSPVLDVRIEMIRWSGELDVLVTDTDFSNGPTTAEVYIDGGFTGYDEATFNFWGDSANQPFGMGQLIYDTTIDQSLNFLKSGTVDADAVGSLTFEVNLRGAEAENSIFARASISLNTSQGTVPVPDVVGQEQTTAEQEITNAGLGVGNVTTEASDTVPESNVISQSPAAGTDVSPGTMVNLVVSAGSAPEEVENMAGLAGLWYDPAFDGEGFNMLVTANNWVIYYYGWRSNGQRLWILSESVTDPISFGQSQTLDMWMGESGVFAQPNPDLTMWGEMTIIFDTCTSGRVHMQGDDGTKMANIVKLAGISDLDCDL
jgi:hypothetical protein